MLLSYTKYILLAEMLHSKDPIFLSMSSLYYYHIIIYFYIKYEKNVYYLSCLPLFELHNDQLHKNTIYLLFEQS